MRMKRLLSVLLVTGLLAGMAAGCGGNSENSGNGSPTQNSEQEENTEQEGNVQQEGETDELTEITVVLRTLGTVDEAGSDAVEEAVNEITKREIQVAVDLMWVDSAKYETQVPMMITSREKLDLMMYTPNPSTTYGTLMTQKQLMDITDYVESYGPAIKDVLGDKFLKATSREGRIYGVGVNGLQTSIGTFFMRRDLLEQAGVLEKAQNATTWTELKEVTKAVADLSGLGMVNADLNGNVLMANPMLSPKDSFEDGYVYDNLGDSANMFMANKETGKVECMFFNEDVKAVMKRTHEWYQDNLIYKDAATAQDFGTTQLRNGVGAGMFTTTEIGGAAQSVAATGYDMITLDVLEPSHSMTTTGGLTKFGFGVPVTATEPEAAIKFLNLLYDGQYGMGDLLSWGIEGRDYVVNEDGYADYPSGVTAETCLYHIADFLYGNRLAITPWIGSMENIREEQAAAIEAAEISPYLGFCISNEGLEATLTSCLNVYETYKGTILSGSSSGDFEAYYKKFQDDLIKAGVEELVAAYQSQLDEWIAANK